VAAPALFFPPDNFVRECSASVTPGAGNTRLSACSGIDGDLEYYGSPCVRAGQRERWKDSRSNKRPAETEPDPEDPEIGGVPGRPSGVTVDRRPRNRRAGHGDCNHHLSRPSRRPPPHKRVITALALMWLRLATPSPRCVRPNTTRGWRRANAGVYVPTARPWQSAYPVACPRVGLKAYVVNYCRKLQPKCGH
jgi:hypothetical protein